MDSLELVWSSGLVKRADSSGGRQIHFAHENYSRSANIGALRNPDHLHRIVRPDSLQVTIDAVLHGFEHGQAHLRFVRHGSKRKGAKHENYRRQSHWMGLSWFTATISCAVFFW